MKRLLFLSLLFVGQYALANKSPFNKPDLEYTFAGVLKEDMFAAKNFSLLNNCNGFDRVWFMRHTLDYILNVVYGRAQCGYPLAEFNFSVRNKGIWGAPSTLAQTTESEVKILDVLTGEHNHFFPRHIFWMREAWLRLSVPDAFHIDSDNEHTFMLGFFPFQLGRGIALGDAYAVGQDFLGMYTDGLVDQFAPAMKLSGELVQKRLFYDFYAAILENMSALLSDTGAKIRAQEFGHKFSPVRGFGRINYLLAGRLRWFLLPQVEGGSTIILEPYWLFNSDPEQDIEFTADASSRLATLGFAADYVSNRIETGFEFAFNLGRQCVRGWDRNAIQFQNRNGQIVSVNSHVLLGADPLDAAAPSNLDLYKDPHAPAVVDNSGNISTIGKTAQTIIENAPQDQCNNGKLIGVVSGLRDVLPHVPNAFGASNPNGLYNSVNRFRNPYANTYKGWMFVIDFAWWNQARDLKLGFETGVASGDNNPNFETIDGDFKGFIGLQEVYAGRKVRSAFVLGGAGKLKRPLSAPEPDNVQAPTQFATNISGFTNLMYTGASLSWIPNSLCKRLSINPNILAFWQEFRTPKFDLATRTQSTQCSSRFLGVEANLFAHYMIFDTLRLFLITSVFVPGQHYKDIRGLPLNSDQNRLLDRLDRTAFDRDQIPNIGNNTAFTFNIGLEFKF